jgi:hypothetical protein
VRVFVILSALEQPGLERRIVEIFPRDHLRFGQTAWFVASPNTAREISDSIGIKKDQFSDTIVVECRPIYWGMAATTLWQWLKSSFEKQDSA